MGLKSYRNVEKAADRPLFRPYIGSLYGRGAAFTLIELLAVVACVSVLAVLCVGAVQRVFASGSKVKEINAARILVAAYTAAAADGDGTYLAGMDYRINTTTNPVIKPDGQKITNAHAAQRYPFRLLPYLGDRFEGSILVNRNKNQILKASGGNASTYDYILSTFPALGMNIFCVGGVVTNTGMVRYSGDCITTVGKMRGSILAFASAGQGTGNTKMNGYSYVNPPTLGVDSPICQAWGSPDGWDANADPTNFGFVDFRYENKAVCAFLDGSVRMCTVKELSDMRVWTPSAVDMNDPNYVLVP